MKRRRTVSKLDKAIIGLISRDIPLVKEPFKEMAETLGIEQEVLLKRMQFFKESALMRKFSAALDHKKIGFRHNAMVVWNVPEMFIDKAGGAMASFDEVSHCYQRKNRDDWNYNLYCMVHGRTKDECLDVVKKISDAIGADIDYRVLFSSREEKKTGARYFA